MAEVASLRAALESERSSLHHIDASIKRIVQSHHDRQYHLDRTSFSGGGGGGGPGAGRYGPRGGEYGEFGRPEETGKRKHETKTVFSRLSAPARLDGESDHEDGAKRPRISSQVTRDLPSKQEIMKAQCGDEQSKVRNRRMFGSLLGTLQKFKQEEMVLQSKEDKKAQVERRIEQQAVQEKEKQRRERQTLFAERELKKATIKALEAKLARVAEFDAWLATQQPLANYILTRARPHVFWLPRRSHVKSDERLAASRAHHHKYIEKKRQELEEELTRIEQRCLRSAKGPQSAGQFSASKENKIADQQGVEDKAREKSMPRKREKFVSEVRVKKENGTIVKVEEDDDQEERTVSKDNGDAEGERKRIEEESELPDREPRVEEGKEMRNSAGCEEGRSGAESEEVLEVSEGVTRDRSLRSSPAPAPVPQEPEPSGVARDQIHTDGAGDTCRPDGTPLESTAAPAAAATAAAATAAAATAADTADSPSRRSSADSSD